MKALTRLNAVLVCGYFVASTFAEEPDPMKILLNVDAATRAVTNVSYQAKVWTESEIDLKQPTIEVAVKARENTGGQLPLLWIDGIVKIAGSTETQPFAIIMNNEQAAAFNKKERTYVIGDLPAGVKLVNEALQSCVMREFVHPTPFTDEIEAVSRKYEGTKTVAGVECHVIYVVYRGGTESRWYFGLNDNLPHRVDRIGKAPGGVMARVLELRDLDIKPTFTDSTFAIEIPAGYQEKQPIRQVPSSPGLLPVGSDAPDWKLKTPEGTEIALSKLRGQVVLLDFWATWCGPCKRVMPTIQKIHETYKGKPLLVYGISTWERGDPARYMAEQKYTYGLLLRGDDAAKRYGVRGIPTIYLIGPDGKVLFAVSGFNPSHEKPLKDLIEGALQEAQQP